MVPPVNDRDPPRGGGHLGAGHGEALGGLLAALPVSLALVGAVVLVPAMLG